nr:fimbrillin family protein [uncultured Bacteroides sp.]
MKGTKYLFFAATVLSLAACSGDDENMGVNNGPVAAQITAGLNVPATRAENQIWGDNDAIGVTVTAAPASDMEAMYRNVEYTISTGKNTQSATFTSATGIYFQDKNETVTFSAYFPYQSGLAENGIISQEDISTMQTDATTQETIDYLYDDNVTATQTTPSVNFTFEHKMTKLILIVKTGVGFNPSEIVTGWSFNLGGLIHKGTFNTNTGVATADATASPVSAWDITDNRCDVKSDDGTRTYIMYLYPQTLTSSGLSFSATYDGQTYTTQAGAINPELVAGNSYEYTITVNQTGLIVSGCTIEPWTEHSEEVTAKQ